jgi:hypothetical protein
MRKTITMYQQKVHGKLLVRQIIFAGIIVIITIISTINIFNGRINPLLAVFGFSLALGVGLLLRRTFTLFWHTEKEKVASRLDILGILVLSIYLFIDVNRLFLFKHWIHGQALSDFSLILIGGLFCGRFLGTHALIHNIVQEQKKM